MEIKVLSKEKDSIEVELPNITLAEILKVYLNKDSSVVFAAWKREHPTKNPILKVRTKGKIPSKSIGDAILAVTKDLDKTLDEFKKMK